MISKMAINHLDSVPVRELARIMGITTRRVQQLAASGIIRKPEKRGRYHSSCVQDYCEHLRKELRRLRAKTRKKKSFWSRIKGFNTSPKKTSEEISLDMEALQASIRETLKKKR